MTFSGCHFLTGLVLVWNLIGNFISLFFLLVCYILFPWFCCRKFPNYLSFLLPWHLCLCVCIEKGVKGNGDRKENKGGSPFEEETGEEVKNALQDEQGHESPKPTPKPKGDDDVKGPGTFR